MVINVGKLKDHEDAYVREEIAAMRAGAARMAR
jgi:deoxyribose-phosphate aldolase